MKTVSAWGNGTVYNVRYNIFDGERDAVGQTEQSPSNGTLVQVYDATKDERTDYIPGPNGALARIKRTAGTDSVTFIHTDHLGTARAGTSATGALLFEDFHTPFGESLLHPDATDDQGDYTGHIRDRQTGLSYMQARYQDPLIGRFLSIDPVTFLDEMKPEYFNRYAYTFNDPINAIDPDGEKVVPVGTPSEVRQINSALKLISDSNPKSRARLKSLRDSKNIHTIRFPKAGEGPSNVATGDPRNASNGIGTGSETVVDPTQSLVDTNSDGTKVVSSGPTVVTHELLGHGGDVDNGTLSKAVDPATGVNQSHIDAVDVENEFKDAIGEQRREVN